MFEFFRIFFLLLFGLPLWSQSPRIKPFKYIRTVKNNSGGIVSIEFRDSSTNKIIKALKLNDINPYFFLDEKPIDSTYQKTPVYLLSQRSPYLATERMKSMQKNIETKGRVDSVNVWSHYIDSYNSQEYIAVVIIMSAKIGNTMVGNLSSIYVFDKTGILVSKIEDINGDYYYPLITSDGKYVLAKNGNDRGEGLGSSVNPGYDLIDIQNSKVIYTKDFCCDFTPSVIDGKLFFIPEREIMQEENIKIIDPYSKNIYERRVTIGPNFLLEKVDENGIHFSDGKKESTFTYKKDFTYSRF